MNDAVQHTDWRATGDAIRNWGAWGPDDEVGTLNYIQPDTIAAAARLVRRGVSFSLSHPLDAYGPATESGFRRNPIHLMRVDGGDGDLAKWLDGWGGETEQEMAQYFAGPLRFTDDYIIMPLQSGTQWDALAHCYYDEQLYNGYSSHTITSFGASKVGIGKAADRGIVSRGVLLDVARARGIDRLSPGTIISPEDLEGTLELQNTEIRTGDILLVRTGWWHELKDTRDVRTWRSTTPGLSWKCATWLHEHRIAAIAADTHVLEVPRENPAAYLTLHMLLIRDMGMMIGELWQLDALAQDCDKDQVYEFLIIASPLNVPGGVGSPVNPIAIK